jgi:uncharacterized paraquat-inducible protein A
MILIAILLPPLVFFLIGRFFAGIISSIFYIIAIVIAFTGILLPVAFIIYLALMIWAIVSRNNAKTEKKMKQMEKRIIASQIANEK